ncbi:hypothetical protein YB2330_006567 [Saitoella coloradoensis]
MTGAHAPPAGGLAVEKIAMPSDFVSDAISHSQNLPAQQSQEIAAGPTGMLPHQRPTYAHLPPIPPVPTSQNHGGVDLGNGTLVAEVTTQLAHGPNALPRRPSFHRDMSFMSTNSQSLPSTPSIHPVTLHNPLSRSPSPVGAGGASPRSARSEPQVLKEGGGFVECMYETALVNARRRIPYSLGTGKLPAPKDGSKKRPTREEEDRLSVDVERLYERLLPSPDSNERRAMFVQRLESILNEAWPGQDIRVHTFGSTENLLCTTTSDVDVCIVWPGWEDLGLKVCAIARILSAKGMERVVCVPGAKVPIVKVWDAELMVACDMNVNNTLALHNTKLVKAYVELDSRVRPLAMIIKYWAKRRILNDAAGGGTLTSYTWICMIINFLQMRNPPVLPCLHRIPYEKKIVDGVDVGFFDDLESLRGFGDKNDESLGGLLYAFFRRFAYEFDYDRHVISVRHGCLLDKEEKAWHLMQNNRLCVEEPFNTIRNLGNTADDTSVKGLCLEFRRAFGCLSEAQPGPSVEECCAPYVFPVEERSKPQLRYANQQKWTGRGGWRQNPNPNPRVANNVFPKKGHGFTNAHPNPNRASMNNWRQTAGPSAQAALPVYMVPNAMVTGDIAAVHGQHPMYQATAPGQTFTYYIPAYGPDGVPVYYAVQSAQPPPNTTESAPAALEATTSPKNNIVRHIEQVTKHHDSGSQYQGQRRQSNSSTSSAREYRPNGAPNMQNGSGGGRRASAAMSNKISTSSTTQASDSDSDLSLGTSSGSSLATTMVAPVQQAPPQRPQTTPPKHDNNKRDNGKSVFGGWEERDLERECEEWAKATEVEEEVERLRQEMAAAVVTGERHKALSAVSEGKARSSSQPPTLRRGNSTFADIVVGNGLLPANAIVLAPGPETDSALANLPSAPRTYAGALLKAHSQSAASSTTNLLSTPPPEPATTVPSAPFSPEQDLDALIQASSDTSPTRGRRGSSKVIWTNVPAWRMSAHENQLKKQNQAEESQKKGKGKKGDSNNQNQKSKDSSANNSANTSRPNSSGGQGKKNKNASRPASSNGKQAAASDKAATRPTSKAGSEASSASKNGDGFSEPGSRKNKSGSNRKKNNAQARKKAAEQNQSQSQAASSSAAVAGPTEKSASVTKPDVKPATVADEKPTAVPTATAAQ